MAYPFYLPSPLSPYQRPIPLSPAPRIELLPQKVQTLRGALELVFRAPWQTLSPLCLASRVFQEHGGI